MLADDHGTDLDGIEGLLVYGDSAVPDQFYYAATRPSIARDGDGYRFTLVRYDRPLADGQAGMLSFVVDLAPAPAVLDRALEVLRRRTPGAQLSPIPWSTGTVTAAVIGGEPVRATPSLLNDNGAVLCLGLTTDQYLLLKHSLDDPRAVPISIVYDLAFEVLRPAYSFSILFDEARFREWIQTKRKVGLLFVSVEKVETFEDLRHSGAITVVSVNEREEDPPVAMKRAFLQSLKALLKPLPAFAPPAGAGDEGGWDIGYSTSTVHDIQTLGRRLDCNMTVRAAVARAIHVQGALTDLAEALRSRPEIELPTSGRFQQDLTIRCHDRFDGAPLQELNLVITPATIPLPHHVFNARGSGEWTVGLPHNPAAPADYACTCTLYFAGDGRPPATGRFAIPRDAAYLDILPAALYTLRRYDVTVAEDCPWPLLQSVRVRLGGLDGLDGLAVSPVVLTLSQSQRSGTIEVFAPAPVNLDGVWFEALHTAVTGGTYTERGYPTGTTIFLNGLRQRCVSFAAAPEIDWRRY